MKNTGDSYNVPLIIKTNFKDQIRQSASVINLSS